MTLAINLEYKPTVPLCLRLADALRKAILDGRLAPGAPMPSMRALSESLKVSRATVLKAYKQLNEEGLVTGRTGSGTFVADWLQGKSAAQEPSILQDFAIVATPEIEHDLHLSERGRLIVATGKKQAREHVHVPALEYGGTPVELCPVQKWRSLMVKHCDLGGDSNIAEIIEPMGIASLRQAIASFVLRRRSIICGSENICLFGSKQLRLDLIGRLLLNAGDVVAYEEPGYPENRYTLEALGAIVSPVPVDSDGLSVEALLALPRAPKLIYVSPSHQDPLGCVMSLERRSQILDYAASVGAFIVEDDFDSEFRYGKPLLPSLKALDKHDCVVYMSSFWKVFYQSMRLSYVIFPDSLAKIAALGKGSVERHLPLLDQLALADFIESGHLEMHLKRTQKQLALRRQRLILAVTRYLKNLVEPINEGAGTHIVLNFRCGPADAAIEEAARVSGFNLMSTRPYYFGAPCGGQYIAPFATVNGDNIDSVVKEFSQLLAEGIAQSSPVVDYFGPDINLERREASGDAQDFAPPPGVPLRGAYVNRTI